MKIEKTYLEKTNATIDIVKLLMAFLVVGIHTEPFGFNVWLDRGFGIITRLCVPFFFVASSYFFWLKSKSAAVYIKRILLLYLIWSIIYLPFDFASLKSMSIQDVLVKFLWTGNDHALWYLCGSVIGFIIVFCLLKILDPKKVFIISVIALLIGCLKSTWAPMIEHFFQLEIHDFWGSRNGLFYAFPYIALGMLIAKNENNKKEKNIKKYMFGLVVSLIMLLAESLVFVLFFHTTSTILWISVLPCTYYVFMLAKNIEIQLPKEKSVFLRKMSTLIYVEHGLFLILFKSLNNWKFFIVVSILSSLLAIGIIVISEKKLFKWMKRLY